MLRWPRPAEALTATLRSPQEQPPREVSRGPKAAGCRLENASVARIRSLLRQRPPPPPREHSPIPVHCAPVSPSPPSPMMQDRVRLLPPPPRRDPAEADYWPWHTARRRRAALRDRRCRRGGAGHVHPRDRRSCQVRTVSRAARTKLSPRATSAREPLVERCRIPNPQSITETARSPFLCMGRLYRGEDSATSPLFACPPKRHPSHRRNTAKIRT